MVDIPVHNPPGGNHDTTPEGPGSAPPTGPGSNPPGGGNKNKKGGGNPYQKAKNRAANRYIDQAETLNAQIRALRAALGPNGVRAALDIKLANIGHILRQSDRFTMSNYHARVGSLAQASADNERAAADQTVANTTNRLREQANAMSEAVLQGAGESDVLRSQQMSLRNWDANQSEVQRSRADSLSSINASLTDLNADTQTARANLVIEANSDREGLWTNYYGQVSELNTQLGNTLGMQAEYYGLANEQRGGKGAKKGQKRAARLSGDAFDEATDALSQAWHNPGVPRRLMRWDGRADFAPKTNMSTYRTPTSTDLSEAPKRPEGASLRSWT